MFAKIFDFEENHKVPNEIGGDFNEKAFDSVIFSENDKEVEKLMTMINFNIELLNDFILPNSSIALNEFSKVEEEIEKSINCLSQYNEYQKNYFLRYSRDILNSQFKKYKYYDHINSIFGFCYKDFLEESIKLKNFTDFFSEIDVNPDQVEFKSKGIFTLIVKDIVNHKLDDFAKKLKVRFNCNSVPKFVLRYYKKEIKREVLSKSKYHFDYKFFINKIFNEQPEFEVLPKYLKDLINAKIVLFDTQILSKPHLECLFKCFILSIVDFLDSNETNSNIFLKNLKRYLNIMNILKSEPTNFEFNLYLSFYDQLKSLDKEKRIQIEKENYEKNFKFIENSSEKYLFIILSMSLLLKNIFCFYDGHSEFNTDLKCSAKEIIFLEHFLRNLQSYIPQNFISPLNTISPLKINNYIDTYLLNDVYKFYIKDLLDQDTKNKKIFENNEIIEKIITSFNTPYLIKLIQNFCKDYNLQNEFEGMISKITGIIKKNLIDRNKLNHDFISSTKIVFNDPKLLTSHVFLCVTSLNNSFFKNLFTNYEGYFDYYIYEWPNDSVKELLNNLNKKILKIPENQEYLEKSFQDGFKTVSTKKIKEISSELNEFYKFKIKAEILGKLLAFILASRAIFKYQTVTLVGYSIGSLIIKSCLKTLYEMSEYHPEVIDIIQNVIFISGSVTFEENNSKWGEIFRLLTGKVYNIYSSNDEVATVIEKYLTLNQTVGLRPLIINNYQVHNFDFESIIKRHSDYKKYANIIFDKINFC